MALNTKDISVKPTDKKEPIAAPVADDTLVLELALYTQYNYHGTMYLKGKMYRFKRPDALILLTEMDAGRPVWRIYREPKKQTVQSRMVDATQQKVVEPGEPVHGVETKPSRIEIGSDDEIQDIVNRPEEEGENVTV